MACWCAAPLSTCAVDVTGGTGRIVAGASKTVVFERRGTFDYYCEIHTTLRGKVVVK